MIFVLAYVVQTISITILLFYMHKNSLCLDFTIPLMFRLAARTIKVSTWFICWIMVRSKIALFLFKIFQYEESCYLFKFWWFYTFFSHPRLSGSLQAIKMKFFNPKPLQKVSFRHFRKTLEFEGLLGPPPAILGISYWGECYFVLDCYHWCSVCRVGTSCGVNSSEQNRHRPR